MRARIRGTLGKGAFVIAASLVGAAFAFACVGDDPLPSGGASTSDASNDVTQDGAESDGGDAGADAAAPKVVHIVAGLLHSCALYDDGHVKCWGGNTSGELGNGTLGGNPVKKPTEVPGLDDAVAIGSGANHTCVATKTKGVKCWGANYFGTIGDGAYGVDSTFDGGNHRPAPTVVPGINDAVKIPSLNNATSCAILATTPPTAKCWGIDGYWQVGADATVSCNRLGQPDMCAPSPVVAQGGINVESIGGGSAHTCVSYGNSAVRCWGFHAGARLGQIGTDGDGSTVKSPALAVSGYAADEVVAGQLHTCGRKGGAVTCWGGNTYGVTGQNVTSGTTQTPSSVQLPAPSAAKQLATRGGTTCALLTNGTVACWGSNGHKQLGSAANITVACFSGSGPALDCRPAAALVDGLSDVTEIAVGNDHVCALVATGGVKCWGSNQNGQLGDGNSGVDVPSPVDVVF